MQEFKKRKLAASDAAASHQPETSVGEADEEQLGSKPAGEGAEAEASGAAQAAAAPAASSLSIVDAD